MTPVMGGDGVFSVVQAMRVYTTKNGVKRSRNPENIRDLVRQSLNPGHNLRRNRGSLSMLLPCKHCSWRTLSDRFFCIIFTIWMRNG
ncbi:MAG: hypothetical protein ACKOX5_08850, partial [Bacteroidota bacterium]